MNPTRATARKKLASFTLVELLVVMAIAAILAAISVSAYTQITRSTTVTTGTQMLIGGLNLARQTAVARNTDVQFCIYELPDVNASSSGPITAFRAFQTFLISGGATNQLSNVSFLPGLAILSTNLVQTTLLNLPLETPSQVTQGPTGAAQVLPGYGSNYKALVFSFSPTGGLEPVYPALSQWYMTLYVENAPIVANKLPGDFATVLIDPFNGSASTFRP